MKLALLSVALFACLLSCSGSLRAIVIDSNGLAKEVTHITTDKGQVMEVLDGLAVRAIKLDRISIINISSKETKSHKGSLYFLSEIWMVDGSKIQTYLLPDGRRSGAYINVHSVLKARTPSGTYSIKIKDIKQIKFHHL